MPNQPTYFDFINTNNPPNQSTPQHQSPSRPPQNADIINNYRAIKHQSDQSLRTIGANLKSVVFLNDNHGESRQKIGNGGANNNKNKNKNKNNKNNKNNNNNTYNGDGTTADNNNDADDYSSMENESLVKIKQVHRNERILKLQYSRLVDKEFAKFHSKLLGFRNFINANFAINSNDLAGNKNREVMSSSAAGLKETGKYRMNEDNSKLVVRSIKNKNDKISQKIANIQFFAEKIDQRIRILEMTKRSLIENRSK
ncbi:hypothetical protein DASC09_009510 [Saccharomycopsis crataegensis]|uniref:Uncharacterized protein n=1 Tax=Saccharomycopsis crataegensis TaxID=43959 RepID=A0AAV5QG31_9ASCO|nr:hypothetical protein DASC09_009510 [Saccharomycopsis crataegensis]